MTGSESKLVIYGAIVANLVIVVAKFFAAAITGSSAMLSEGIHSLVDSGNGLLILLGTRLSKRPPDELHPYGHGLDLYFWTLIVAVLIFGVGGGASIYEGIEHLKHPEPLASQLWNYIVLGIALVAESVSWWLAFRGLQQVQAGRSLWATIRDSKDPTVFTIFIEDSAALAGILIAGIGVFLAGTLHAPWIDGAASILIGLLLAGVALLLVRESRALMLGESADQETVESISRLVGSDRDVVTFRPPLTLHFSPDQILVCLEVEFRRGLSAENLVDAIARVESSIRHQHPHIQHVFLEAQRIRSVPALLS